MLYAAASNIDAFLWRDTCVSSYHLYRPIWTKQRLSPPWKYDLKQYSFQKLTQFS
jgi:hypothetical protein